MGGGLDALASLHGPLLGINQSSEVAELVRFLMYLDNVGLGPYVFFSDCDWVVSSFPQGRIETTGAMHACADLWGGVARGSEFGTRGM